MWEFWDIVYANWTNDEYNRLTNLERWWHGNA